jgi:gamma-glutamylputrescine oxidase
LHPLRYTFALATLAQQAGVTIFEQSRMIKYSLGKQTTISTEQATVTCQQAVFCLNGYHNNCAPELEYHVMPINNYICATEPLSEKQAQTLIRNDYAVADSRFIINYFRLSRDRRLLFGGGETYRYRFPKNIPALVSRPMLTVFPQLKGTRIDYAWGGTLGITRSRLPFFSRLANNLFTMGGYSGQGIALATWAGKIAADAVSGQSDNFDIFSRLPHTQFPGGALLRHPALVTGMLWYALLDKL